MVGNVPYRGGADTNNKGNKLAEQTPIIPDLLRAPGQKGLAACHSRSTPVGIIFYKISTYRYRYVGDEHQNKDKYIPDVYVVVT